MSTDEAAGARDSLIKAAQTDADALRSLAADLESDAQEVDPGTPVEGGLVEGLGRAAGKARARAKELESE